jgi:hypothetical protein
VPGQLEARAPDVSAENAFRLVVISSPDRGYQELVFVVHAAVTL